jgi:Skp family chaperone for outer membrane proteins
MKIRYLLLALPLLSVAAFPQDDKGKPKSKSGILILNIFRCVEESDEGRAVVAKLRQERAAQMERYSQEMAKLQEKVKELREKKPQDHTADYYKELQAAMSTYAKLEVEKNVFGVQMGDDLARSLQQLILGAQEAARAEMKEREADFVLFSKGGPVEVATETDFNQELLMRRVICADPNVDITEAVIRRMNDWYAKNKSTQGIPKREGVDAPPAKEGDAAKPPKVGQQ